MSDETLGGQLEFVEEANSHHAEKVDVVILSTLCLNFIPKLINSSLQRSTNANICIGGGRWTERIRR